MSTQTQTAQFQGEYQLPFNPLLPINQAKDVFTPNQAQTTTDNQSFGEVNYLEKIQADTLKLAKRLIATDNETVIFDGLNLAESVADDNLFVGFGMFNRDGETFTGRGNLCGTTSRLDRFYLQRQAKINRQTIPIYLNSVQLLKCELWRFITLTMPILRGLGFALTNKIMDDAFKFLRDDKFWREKVRAGVKSKEFTLGEVWINENREWTPDDGYHVHLHLIVASTWIENRKINKKTGEAYYRDLAEAWRKALLKSAKKNNVTMEFQTEDDLPIVDVRLIKNRADSNNQGEISLHKAIQETAKYITKQETFHNLPIEQISEINAFLKGKRMIEPLGVANARQGSKTRENGISGAVLAEPENKLNFTENIEDEDATSVLNNKTIEKFSMVKRNAIQLIKQGNIAEARRIIHQAFERTRAFRRRQLARQHPTAVFITLSGETWCLDDYQMPGNGLMRGEQRQKSA
jgi:Replication protein